MKTLIFVTILLATATGHAAVNLDQSVGAGTGERMYRSTVEPNTIYFMPQMLESLDEPRVEDINGEFRAFFNVGISPTALQLAQAAVSGAVPNGSLQITRGIEISWLANSFDIPVEFKPRLVALGNAGDLGGPVPYVLILRKIGPLQGKQTKALLDKLFKSERAKHIGLMSYQFSAFYIGKPYAGQSTIGIFSTNNANKGGVKSSSVLSTTAPETRILLDAETGCWNKPEMNVICLK